MRKGYTPRGHKSSKMRYLWLQGLKGSHFFGTDGDKRVYLSGADIDQRPSPSAPAATGREAARILHLQLPREPVYCITYQKGSTRRISMYRRDAYSSRLRIYPESDGLYAAKTNLYSGVYLHTYRFVSGSLKGIEHVEKSDLSKTGHATVSTTLSVYICKVYK